MSIRTRKSKRTKFGLFSSQSEANKICEEKAKLERFKDSNFYVIKVSRRKEGQNPWLAYCLTKK